MNGLVQSARKRTQTGHVGSYQSTNQNHHSYKINTWKYAPPNMRLLAMAVDLSIIGLLMLILIMLEYGDIWLIDAEVRLDLTTYFALSCIPFLYFVGFQCVFSASPGKLLLSLQVLDAETQTTLSTYQCVLRYFGYLLLIGSLGLGLGGIFNGRKAQGWHDRLAHTVVVQR
jgi:uncharacterized RDD family membrane protein YckC